MPRIDNRPSRAPTIRTLAASLTFAIPLAAVSLLAVPVPAGANESEARKAVLLKCAEQQIAVEKTSKHPSADRVLEACKSELLAFESLYPAEIAAGARQHLKHLIQHRLE